uniref:Uncharacterized protein n=1 Tax=Anguilla anguilla TaxID=7936 RepID=A0A0E9VYU4_ANGAN
MASNKGKSKGKFPFSHPAKCLVEV